MASNIMMIMNPDGKEVHTFPMSWVKVDDYLDIFECYYLAKDIGLYWYHFVIDTPFGKRFSRLENGKISFTDDFTKSLSLQLTVYERLYEVPSFLKGGLIYQIFPDRFLKGNKIIEASGKVAPEDLKDKSEEVTQKGLRNDLKNIALSDRIKSRYHIRKLNDDYDNRKERSIVLRDDWGGEPIWKEDVHGDILNNDFFGGNLDGIRQKLPYLKSLGVTVIYLNPVFEAYSNHRYDTGNYMKIDPLIGDENDFLNLCKEAKALGIAIIIDGVFNHTGDDSLYFNRYGTYESKGAWGHPDSLYRDFYEWTSSESYNSWWGVKVLPTSNKSSPGFRDLIFGKNGVIQKWIRLGASGWRLDVVDELPTEFLRKLVKAAKKERRDAAILGEVWEDASNKIAYGKRRTYFLGEELDSSMNYPWKNAIISFLKDGNSEVLEVAVTDICSNYPEDVLNCLMNPLGTHDSVRILTALAGPSLDGAERSIKAKTSLSKAEYQNGIRLLKLAFLIQMLLPGVPSIYYGDEAGMEGYNDPFNRRCYPWGHENLKLREWVRALGNLRSRYRDFFGNSDCNVLRKYPGSFSFMRSFGGMSLLCIVNRGKKDLKISLKNKWKRFESLSDPEAKGSEDVFLGTVKKDEDGSFKVCVPQDFGYIVLIK